MTRYIRAPQAFTKKTFTRWKPDWVAAVLAFEQAVKQYKLAKNKEKLIDANVQLAGAQVRAPPAAACRSRPQNRWRPCCSWLSHETPAVSVPLPPVSF